MAASQDGPATAAMRALIANESCGDDVIDDISKGDTPVQRVDLMQALRLASHHLQTHPVLANQLYMKTSCQLIKDWSDDNLELLYIQELWRLTEWFRDMCTTIQKLQEAVDKRGTENHKNSLLHGRPLQNEISLFRADCYKHQHWNELYNYKPIVGRLVELPPAVRDGGDKDHKG